MPAGETISNLLTFRSMESGLEGGGMLEGGGGGAVRVCFSQLRYSNFKQPYLSHFL